MRMNANFPVADRNRLIKEASETLFKLMKPVTWHAESFGGDDDFGLDVHVQVSGDAGVQHAFYVQLKGTENPDLTADGLALRYPLKRSTLNYYANLPQEVMLVVCIVALDGSGSLNIAGSQVYWQWISDVLKERRGSEFALDLSDTRTATIQVPLNQILSGELNISARLQSRIEQLRFAVSLEEILAGSSMALGKDRSAALAHWAETMRGTPEDFAALVFGQNTFDANTMPAEAVELRTLIRAGRTDSAALALERMGPDGFGALPANRAMWLSLSGKVAMQRNRHQEALQLFEAAYSMHASEEHLLALAETKFLAAVDANLSDEILSVRESLATVQSDNGLALLVRVLVALDDIQGAQDCVDKISPSAKLMPRLVLLSGMHEWERIIELALDAECDRAISDSDRTAIQLVAARAAWFKALETSPSAATATETPLSGPVGTAHEFARTAWNFELPLKFSLPQVT